jgi:glycosyltransferase involved in cell wall biosynthesis
VCRTHPRPFSERGARNEEGSCWAKRDPGIVSAGRIRLLQLVHGYPPAVGGVELSIRDMCERLVDEYDFEVTVLTTDAYTVSNFHDPSLPTIPIDPDEVQHGVRVMRFPTRAWRSRLLRQPQRLAYRLRLPGHDWLRTWFNGPISPDMRAATLRAQADVICAAAFPLNHVHYPFRRPRPRTPVVIMPSIHTTDAWGFERRNLLRLCGRAFATVARTGHEREWLLAHGVASERVRVIGHGFEPGELRPRPGAFRASLGIDPSGYLVAYLGQQGAHKGIEVLLASFPWVLEQCPDAWLTIGGARTGYTTELERQLARLPPPARARCRLVCDLSEQVKADLLGDCDVLATPSGKEAFGITTLEAWSLGKPVVVGDSPSQASVVIDGESGLIVPYGDVERLTGALTRLGRDPPARVAIGRAGRARLLANFRRSHVERLHAELLSEAARSSESAAAQPVTA